MRNKLARIETITRTLGYSETTIEDVRVRLSARASILEDRADKLSDVSHAYETATETDPTPEQEAHLERLIAIAYRARNMQDDLEHRSDLLRKALSVIEEAIGVRRDRQDDLTRGRNKRRKANTSD